MLDDVPLVNKVRDSAWGAFIKRKGASRLFADKEFEFPLNGGFYAMWCICWAKAWDAGFHKGVESKPELWAGLTDEDIEQGWKESWVNKQAFESAVWWAEKKLKEKNHG
jgi:hypothetical protein